MFTGGRLLVVAVVLTMVAGQCFEGYYQDNGNCYLCIPSCRNCLDPYSCVSCLGGYRYNAVEGICIRNARVNIFGIIIFAVFVGLFVILLLMMVAAMIKHRRRMQNRPQQVVTIPVQTVPPVDMQTLNAFNSQIVHFDIVNDECSICLENQCNALTVCGHYYHFKCIKEWTKHQVFCPNCKHNCMYLKSRCPGCLHFTRNFQMCPQSCQAEDHYICVSPQLLGECGGCIVPIEQQRLPESEFRLSQPPHPSI